MYMHVWVHVRMHVCMHLCLRRLFEFSFTPHLWPRWILHLALTLLRNGFLTSTLVHRPLRLMYLLSCPHLQVHISLHALMHHAHLQHRLQQRGLTGVRHWFLSQVLHHAHLHHRLQQRGLAGVRHWFQVRHWFLSQVLWLQDSKKMR